MKIFSISVLLTIAHVAAATYLYFNKLRINLPKLLLVSQLVCLLLIYIDALLITLSYHEVVIYLAGIDFILGSTLGPIVYIYTVSFIRDERKSNRAYLYYFIIPFVFLAAMIIGQVTFPDFFTNLPNSANDYRRFVIITHSVLLVHLLVYIGFSIIHYNRMQNALGQRSIRLKAIGKYLRGFVVTSLVIMHVCLLGSREVQLIFPPIAIIAFYSYVIWCHQRISKVKSNNHSDFFSHTNRIDDKELADIYTYLDSNKPFTNHNFSLDYLASQINVNRNRLSFILNHKMGKSFTSLVNDYRVNEVQKRLTDPHYQHLTIEGIAQDVGFSSRASFYEIFKKHTGMTPSEYRNRCKISEN